jgi:hypothetical protein
MAKLDWFYSDKKGQHFLKIFDQTVFMICKYAYGNKEACTVLENSQYTYAGQRKLITITS